MARREEELVVPPGLEILASEQQVTMADFPGPGAVLSALHSAILQLPSVPGEMVGGLSASIFPDREAGS